MEQCVVRRMRFWKLIIRLKQKAYVEWKYNALQNLVTTAPKERRSGGNRRAARFTMRSLPELTEIYHWFYKNGSKQIPDKLLIHPLSLSVWFMDDGAKSYRALYLNAQKFARD